LIILFERENLREFKLSLGKKFAWEFNFCGMVVDFFEIVVSYVVFLSSQI